MSIYINTNKGLENYKMLKRGKYFVDKSQIIEIINQRINTNDRFICITRPRRFGKSSIADMLSAYYTKNYDSKDIFNELNISKSSSYLENLNKYNVINIQFNEIPDEIGTYKDYIENIKRGLKSDIKSVFKNIDFDNTDSISRMLTKTKEKFVFIFDEWDYIFSNNLFKENQDEYLEFLRNLLKDKSYVSLAYMTGVLPIKKYSSGSALNMFDEDTMLNDFIYGNYFGFTEKEVIKLCEKQNKISFEKISEWYNGYTNSDGYKIYNPRSVVKALQNGRCISYWTNTGAMNEVKEYLKYNILDVREDVIKMVNGLSVKIIINEEFRAGQNTPKTRQEIYSAMIVLGFLSYYEGFLKIPNKELMKEFENAISDEAFGYVSKIINNSENMLNATLNQDSNKVAEILHDIHNSEIPIFQYNDENSLSCVVTLAYLKARDLYRIVREEKTGKGYADFTFHPRRKGDTAIILELKKDEKVDKALKQIKEKEYTQKFIEEQEYNIIAVAICYDSKTKEHHCKIESL